MELLGTEMPFEEFDRLICEQSNGKELRVINGKVEAVEIVPTAQEIAQAKIEELKQKLQETDYLAIKFAEGELTEQDFATTKAMRKAWRAEINKLEREL